MAVRAVDDFDAINARVAALRESRKPPLEIRGGSPGDHCYFCPKSNEEQCALACPKRYEEVFGFPPPALETLL